MQALLRPVTMFVLAIGLGAASASYQQFGWFPDAEAVRVRLERRHQVAARDLRKKVGIDLAGFRQALQNGTAVIDARDPQAFAAGHLRLDREPPTLNIFPDRGLEGQFARLNELAGMDVVIYCNSDTCELAEELYVLLEQAGLIDQFRSVRIYFAGWDGLKDTDLPQASGADTWAPQALEDGDGDEAGLGDGSGADGDSGGPAGEDPEQDEAGGESAQHGDPEP